ncbi:TIGR02680 family protein [Kitasatospora griseola]
MTPHDEALNALLEGRLPIPSRKRFQPLRMGLIGIWEYDEQEFFFFDGRLILRGHNGSGKTKALEVTSPLLLDAILDARRLDPFGTAARTMRENLLYAGRTRQVGYVWCEYGRIADDGTHVFLTIGLGMRADEVVKGPVKDPWFFVTDRRMGEELHLYHPHTRQPYIRKALTEQLGADSVFDNAGKYRGVVAERLFGFSAARLRALVKLLLILRRPKLSENFDALRLSGLLRQSLPAVNTGLLEDLAGKFDELARERDELAAHQELRSHLETFLSAYRRFGRQRVKSHSRELVEAAAALATARTEHGTHTDRLGEANLVEKQLRELGQRLGQERDLLEVRGRELSGSPEMKEHGLLNELQQQLVRERERVIDCCKRSATAAGAKRKAETKAEEALGRRGQALAALEEAESDAVRTVQSTRLVDVHRDRAPLFRTAPDEAERLLTGYVDARLRILDSAQKLAQQLLEARHKYEAQETAAKVLVQQRTEANGRMDAAETELTRTVQALRTFLADWADRCRELRLSEERLAVLGTAVPRFGLEGSRSLVELVDTEAEPLSRVLTDAMTEAETQRRSLQADRKKVRAQRDRTARQTDPEPPPPAAPRSDRSERSDDGAPLWKLLEFEEHLAPEDRAGVEAALLGAGVLDAWVTADGRVLDPSTLETVLTTASQRWTGRTLADVLEPAVQSLVSVDRLREILRSIALVDSGQDGPETGTWVCSDGSWRNGPLHGRSEVARAAYIGAAARAAERLWRLRELDEQLLKLDQRMIELVKQKEELQNRMDILAEERGAVRGREEKVVSAQRALVTAQSVYAGVDGAVQQAHIEQHRLGGLLADARTAAEDYGRINGVETDSIAIKAEGDALSRYRMHVQNAVHRGAQWLDRAREAQGAQEALAERVLEEDERIAEQVVSEGDCAELEERIKLRTEAVGARVEEVLEALEKCRRRQLELKGEQSANTDQHNKAVKEIGALEEKVRTQEEAVRRHVAEHERTAGRFRKLDETGYLELAGLAGSGSPDALAEEALVRLRQEADDDVVRNDARTGLDNQFRMLQTGLADPHWRPRWDNDGDLVVVSIVHNGTPIRVPAALEQVTQEIETRKSLLDETERMLFADVILGRISNHLRQQRARAKLLIDRMNTMLAEAPTASGMVLQLVWEADPEQPPEAQAALELLDSPKSVHLTDDARQPLIDFLVRRVEEARSNEAGTGDWKTHLREALDYRMWSRIRIQSQTGRGARFTDLTNEKQQKGSGGEKAVMLQLPLFVAAAAHYEDAARTAPRPVYLDEAFAGIDSDMRGRCMGLLARLDLDVVMASHDEWGFHEEVPGVATHQLFRHDGVPGVLVTPMIWDGERRYALTDPALTRGPVGGDGIEWSDEEDEENDEDIHPEDDEIDSDEAWSLYPGEDIDDDAAR